ncbi:hypothetical protein [Vibrio sinaloensis]|uniref:hypothetical protein n=1 Tax=Photobacterium sp. (strain ATCC 43367) TaxID=379097 RepID=UPI0035E9E17E
MIPLLAAAVFITALALKLRFTHRELLCWLLGLLIIELALPGSVVWLLIAAFISAPFLTRMKNKLHSHAALRTCLASALLITGYLNLGG